MTYNLFVIILLMFLHTSILFTDCCPSPVCSFLRYTQRSVNVAIRQAGVVSIILVYLLHI